MSTELYLVRHGQTEYNRLRIVQGSGVDSSLNETGRQQAQHLGNRLAEVQFSAIYSSTLRRAKETAAILAEHHPQTPFYQNEDLEEISWGIFEGREVTPDLERRFEKIKDNWRNGAFEETVEGGETIIEVQERSIRAVDSIVERHAGEKVLVVTHGRLLRILISSLLESQLGLQRMHKVHHDNTGLNYLVFKNGSCRAEFLNCLQHLDQPAPA